MGKNITMKDIAKELQVSTVTVSKALSDKEGVSEAVRQKIKQKADEMGYRYNSLARSMKEGVSYNVGVVVAERFFSDNAFYANLYQRLVIELSKENYSCILEILSYEDEKQDVMPKMISGNKVDGLIVLGQLKKHYVTALEKEDITYMFLDWYDEQFAIDTVVSDNVYGGCILTNYLIENGHRRIGLSVTLWRPAVFWIAIWDIIRHCCSRRFRYGKTGSLRIVMKMDALSIWSCRRIYRLRLYATVMRLHIIW